MILWSMFALMTIGAVIAVWWPLTRRARPDRSGSDIVVYRDQLDEIGRDEAASLIGSVEAEAARVEVSRRLIAASESANASVSVNAPAPSGLYRRATLAAAILLLSLGAGFTYVSLGSPNLVPVSMDVATGGQSLPEGIESTVAEVENFLESNPKNGRGWELLAPVYLRLGRFDDAVRARRNALEIFGPDAARLGDLGEAIVVASNGAVTPEAKELFDRAEAADPDDVMAQFYLGLSAKQAGQKADAERRWRALVSAAPAGAEWLPMVKNALARIDEKDVAVASPPPDHPVVAPPEHNGGAIEAMVARLAERLKKDGSDVPGWIQLVRSYRVLGKADKVKLAISDAHTALAGNQEALQQLEQGLAALDGEMAANAAASGPAAPPPASANAASKGPNASDIAAASQMAPADRNGMIESMVARLAQRLAENGSDVDGWLRLIKAYSVLGERDKALTAASSARQALAGNSDNLRRIGELTKELGLEGS
jgi:cytochrome c-type biogenesis protein CcmH